MLLGLDYMAQHPQEFLSNFYLKSKRSVAKATTEGPAAWAILNDGKRPALAAQLAGLMQSQGAEVQRLDQDFEVKPTAAPKKAAESDSKTEEKPEADKPESESNTAKNADAKKPESKIIKVPKGSYIIRMDQPYSRMADMLLDTQYYSTADPRPYDDTGWTLGPLRNVSTLRITDAAILKVPMTMIDTPARNLNGGIAEAGAIKGKQEGKGKTGAAKCYIIQANAEPSLAALRYRLKDAKIFAAEEPFDAADRKFAAGSFLIPIEGNSSSLEADLRQAASDLGIQAVPAALEPTVARHALDGAPHRPAPHLDKHAK